MPECFMVDHSKTRVILDCTGFRIEGPATVENRVFPYSHYTHCFTAKVLIGRTSGGLITFKLKANGGRTSDTQITIDSRIVDLLNDDACPEIKSVSIKQEKTLLDSSPIFDAQ